MAPPRLHRPPVNSTMSNAYPTSDEIPTCGAESELRSVEHRPPLILLPGLGGGPSLFDSQRSSFPELLTPGWIRPEKNEPLVDYAARFARAIDPGRACFLGGVSFGGVVALEVATHLSSMECFLIGSIRSPQQIPKRLRIFQPVTNLVMIPKWLSPAVMTCGGRWMTPKVRGCLRQLIDCDDYFLRWAARAILNWTPSPGVAQISIVQIHGDCDPIFPVRRVNADKRVPGAGHLVSLTHSAEVNRFLRDRILRRCYGDSEGSGTTSRPD